MLREPLGEVDRVAAFEQAVGGIDHEAQPGDTGSDRQHLRCRLVHGQPACRQKCQHRRLPRPKLPFPVGEECEIIDVTQIGRAAQFSNHVPIQRIQVDV